MPATAKMLFERVSIFDNNQYMADADYQIRASNQELPRANVGGLLDAANLHVYLGRYFNGNDANSGSWLEPDGFRTQIHEFGHYGLFLQDSYFYYDFVVRKVDGNCTSLAIRTNSTPLINATLMDYQYNAAQFSMRDISGLWSVNCEKTRQWQVNKRSDWETISDRYRDQQSPQRWTIRTPADRGGVVPGPTSIPINSWFSVAIADNTEQNVCGSLVTAKVSDGSGNPAVGVDMTLRKTNRVIVQGKTDADGQITVLGAANGDRLVANGWDKICGSTLLQSFVQ
jgi:hypothetical protein